MSQHKKKGLSEIADDVYRGTEVTRQLLLLLRDLEIWSSVQEGLGLFGYYDRSKFIRRVLCK